MGENFRRTKVVIFFGADGTGKSTQAAMLLREFKRRGLKTRKAWIRARHSLAYIVSQLLIKICGKTYKFPQSASRWV